MLKAVWIFSENSFDLVVWTVPYRGNLIKLEWAKMKDTDQLCTSNNFPRTVRGLLLKTDFQPQSLHRQLPGVEIFFLQNQKFSKLESSRLVCFPPGCLLPQHPARGGNNTEIGKYQNSYFIFNIFRDTLLSNLLQVAKIWVVKLHFTDWGAKCLQKLLWFFYRTQVPS